MTAVWFVLAAGLGAGVRFLVAVKVGGWVATWLVNLAGSGVLGWIVAGGVGPDAATVAGIGFCGAMTTYSTLVLEVADRTPRRGAVIVTANVIGCLATAALGAALAGA